MACPFIDEDEPRCRPMLQIDRLLYVLEVCADRFETCPIYQQLAARPAQAEESRQNLRRCA
jgi:hypothetical protein